MDVHCLQSGASEFPGRCVASGWQWERNKCSEKRKLKRTCMLTYSTCCRFATMMDCSFGGGQVASLFMLLLFVLLPITAAEGTVVECVCPSCSYPAFQALSQYPNCTHLIGDLLLASPTCPTGSKCTSAGLALALSGLLANSQNRLQISTTSMRFRTLPALSESFHVLRSLCKV